MGVGIESTPAELDFVRKAIDQSREERARRVRIVEAARATRRRSRELRRRALESRDVALDHRWQMWSVGLTGPPDFVPRSWAELADVDELLERAAAACRECRDVALPRRAFRTVGALCDVAAEHLASHHPDSDIYLSATARLIERMEAELTGAPEHAVIARAFALCRESCRSALAGLHG